MNNGGYLLPVVPFDIRSSHPCNGFTNEKCPIGQECPIWFLNYPPGKVDLTCIMAILFPILSAECDYDTGNTDAEVRKCASEGNKFGIYLLVLME